jgi:hypothetical protein
MGRFSVQQPRFRPRAARRLAQRELLLKARHHRPAFFLAFDFVFVPFAGVTGLSASFSRCSFRANFASRIARSWSTRGEGCLLIMFSLRRVQRQPT